MMWTSTLALCAASSAAVAVPLLLRLSAVKAQRNLYYSWWERDSGRAIVAEAELDLIREQRRGAGRQSHKAQTALFAATTEKLKQCVAARDATAPLDAGPCSRPANRTAREAQPSPAPLYPCAGSTAAPLIDPVEQKGASHG